MNKSTLGYRHTLGISKISEKMTKTSYRSTRSDRFKDFQEQALYWSLKKFKKL